MCMGVLLGVWSRLWIINEQCKQKFKKVRVKKIMNLKPTNPSYD